MDDGLGIGSLPLLTREQEAALLERMRAGDEQAQHRVLLAVLRIVLPSTKTRICNGVPGMWRIELADVMQHTYAALLEHLPKVIELDIVMGCLITRAQRVIGDYLQKQRSLVLVSTKARFPVPIVDSLDEPYQGPDGEEDETVGDRLAAPVPSVGMADLSALYEAARRLPLRQRQALVEYFGLDGEALGVDLEQVGEMSKEHQGKARRDAEIRLRQQLAAAYPQYAGEYRRAKARPASADVSVTPAQRERLTQAYQGMCARQEKITLHGLARASKVTPHAVIAFLYQIRGGSAA